MSVRTKSLLIVGTVIVALIALLYIMSSTLLAGSYEALEVRESEQNMQRVLNAIESQIDQIKLIATDWAIWDDVRDFIQQPTQRFINANLVDVTYLTVGFNYSAFLDVDGQFVHEKMVDLELEQEITPPNDMRHHLQLTQPLMEHNGDHLSEITGIVQLDEGIMFVVSLPVTNSEGLPPINGYMVWGRLLSDTFVQQINDVTGFDVTVRSYTDGLPADMEAAKARLNDAQLYVNPINDDTVATYRSVNDIYGQPALMVRMQAPRAIVQLGKHNWNYFLLSLALLGITSVVVTLLLLERVVMSRLARLSNSMALIGTSGNMNIPIDTDGQDELSHLGVTFRQMLDTLAFSHDELQEAYDLLEESTFDLARANGRLSEEVTERKTIQEALAVARDQALEALRLKTEILANVSHDARTPLNVITLNTETLQRGHGGELNERGKRMLANILINAQHLLTFHNNLLGEAQLGHTKVQLQKIPLDIANLLEDVAALTQPLAERKGLTFITHLNPELNHLQGKLVGDPDRLKQMVVNLVDNAIKFTEIGSIKVAAHLHDETQWAIDVTDTGSGIPNAAQPQLFDAFYQVDGSVTRSANRGVGLGLSIVKQLANLMGAAIQVKSEVGTGTTFTIVLPYQRDKQDDEHSEAA